jgi:hypothetical protein
MKKILPIFVCAFILQGCASETDNLPGFENEIFREFVQNGSSFRILDLEDLVIQRYEINESNKIDIDPITTGISNPRGIEKTDSVLVVINSPARSPAIAFYELNGELINSVRPEGEGPGEFRYINAIRRNQNTVVLFDSRLAKMAEISSDLQIMNDRYDPLLTSSDRHGAHFFSGHLFLRSSSSFSENMMRYAMFEGDSLSEAGSIMPRLIPHPKQPGPMNNVTITANNKFLYAAYAGLPYIFSFNTDLTYQSWYLKQQRYKELENPRLIPFVSNEPVNVSSYIGMAYANDNHLFLGVSPGVLAVFDVSDSSDDPLTPIALVQFFDEPTEANPAGRLWIIDITADDDMIYFVDQFRSYMYKVPLKEIL